MMRPGSGLMVEEEGEEEEEEEEVAVVVVDSIYGPHDACGWVIY